MTISLSLSFKKRRTVSQATSRASDNRNALLRPIAWLVVMKLVYTNNNQDSDCSIDRLIA